MFNRPLKKSDIVGLVEAQGKTTDDISQRLVALEESVNSQESRNQNIIYAVLIAFLLVIGTMVADVFFFNASSKKDVQFYSELEKNIYDQNLKIQDLNNKVDNVKIRNPYLK